jgi:hypothetical protein
MPSLEPSIDQLYQQPLADFVSARTALAKTLKGDDAKRVKSLEKPTVVPWAVNQLYWHARPVYDRLLKSGAALRTAQIAALGGRTANVRGATDAHRKAVADAVAETVRLAAAAGLNPATDALSQTLEVLSLSATAPEAPGRLTKLLRPSGFEALAGVIVKAPAHTPSRPEPASEKKPAAKSSAPRLVEDARARERKEAEERQKKEEIKKAEAALARAQSAEAEARDEWERRKRELETAEKALKSI